MYQKMKSHFLLDTFVGYTKALFDKMAEVLDRNVCADLPYLIVKLIYLALSLLRSKNSSK